MTKRNNATKIRTVRSVGAKRGRYENPEISYIDMDKPAKTERMARM
jgi:hypothetical protein